jgi:hypothetical protein
MLGRPNCGEPVLKNTFAGPWLKTFVATDFTKATSSTIFALGAEELRPLFGECVHEREALPLHE